ncbi:MAG: choice-of-anchor Q domain-containing protein, partial [Acidobacteriota bacterium]
MDNRSRWQQVLPAIVSFLLAAGLAGTAVAATITVNTATDELNADGDCSLREAIQAANTDAAADACAAGSGPDTIILPAGVYVLTLAGPSEDMNKTGDLDIFSDVTLAGAGSATTLIDGNLKDRVLDLLFNAMGLPATVQIRGVTITGGKTPPHENGGGLRNFITLSIFDSTVSGNQAKPGGSIFDDGGGIENLGDLVMGNCTVNNNAVSNVGGGIHNNGGHLSIRNSTIHANTGVGGGGLWNTQSGSMDINNATISRNLITNPLGAGIWNDGGGTVRIWNTIVAANTDGSTTFTWPDTKGFFSSLGHNLIGDGTGSTGFTGPGDQVGTTTLPIDPLLGPLANNGGPTFTLELLLGSPALDAGDPAMPGSGGSACEALDQRGVARPEGPLCDIGAFERKFPSPPPGDCLPEPPGMTAWWPLDETTGPTAFESIFSNDGAHINGPLPLAGMAAGAL